MLPYFYRLQKSQVLGAAVDTLAANINSKELQQLADRLSLADDVGILIVDDVLTEAVSTADARDSVLQRMTRADCRRLIKDAAQSQLTQYTILVAGNAKREALAQDNRMMGRNPSQVGVDQQHMIAYRQVTDQNGTLWFVMVDVRITPVDATVQTLKSQYLFIAIIMVLLGTVLSLVLSRRIAQPIIATNDAAKGLALGRYVPSHAGVSYSEIEQLNRTLIKAAEDLRRVEIMQRELIANISHDLRTPLTLIEGYAEAMRDLPGENTPQNMQVIIDEAKRLTSLVNAVLEYSAMQNGQASISPSRYNITQSIRGILIRYQKLVEKEGYTIRFDPAQELWVQADEMKIGQVVYNLVNNALTYTGADRTVTVTQRASGAQVRIEVRDSGAGIEPQELPHIWNRYYRGAKPHKRATVGTGLGLSIVRSVLEAHGLHYGVVSQPDQGTVFWFTLPLS